MVAELGYFAFYIIENVFRTVLSEIQGGPRNLHTSNNFYSMRCMEIFFIQALHGSEGHIMQYTYVLFYGWKCLGGFIQCYIVCAKICVLCCHYIAYHVCNFLICASLLSVYTIVCCIYQRAPVQNK